MIVIATPYSRIIPPECPIFIPFVTQNKHKTFLIFITAAFSSASVEKQQNTFC